MELKFYAACLASYNSGVLHGAWIDLSDYPDADDLQESVNAMLAASPVSGAEEWVVHDLDDPTGALSCLGETSDLKAIAKRAEAVMDIADDFDEGIAKILLEWVRGHQDDPDHWKSTIDDAFAGIHSNPENYAAENSDAEGVPAHLENYIDWRAFARDMALNGDVDFICTSTGSYLQDYDSMCGRECVVMYNH